MYPRPSIDLLIEARWIIPVEPENLVLEQHALAVDAGRIVAVLPAAEAAARYEARRSLSLDQHVLLPGLVNLHTQAATHLLRGYDDDLPRHDAQQRLAALEARHLGVAFVRDGTWLAGAEMLRGGITCFHDLYFHPEAAAEAVMRLGMRAVLGIMVKASPSAYAADADDYLGKGLAARDSLRGENLIGFSLAAPTLHELSDQQLERIMVLANQLDLPLHLPVHESQAEIAASLKQCGLRPLARLQRLGFLGPGLIAQQAVHLEADELGLLGEQACAVAHCPTMNMRMGSGTAPIAALRRLGVRIGLGSGTGANNPRLDLWREMQQAALLARLYGGDNAPIDAHAILRMATLDGAAALGLDDRLGSLRAGKEADLCAVRLGDGLQPCHNVAAKLVFGAAREQVTHVWVAGVERVSTGALCDTDAAMLRDLAQSWHNACTN